MDDTRAAIGLPADHTMALPPSPVPPADGQGVDDNGRAEPLSLPSPGLPRWAAGLQVLLVCGIPTQLGIFLVLSLGFGMPLFGTGGELSLTFFATLSLLDTVVIAVLIGAFLRTSGERARTVFIGTRPIVGEALRGIALLPVVFLAVLGIVLTLRALVPWTHTVEQNPLEAFMRNPLDAAIFIVVVVLAGGVREELQRAFILHRFEQRLGGVRLGLVIFSITFGLLHFEQGVDIAIAVGVLGLVWGIIYIKRRSAVLPMVNHASFNALQVVQGLLVRSFGA